MRIWEDLHKKDDPEEIPYFDNDKLSRYYLGNDKVFIDALLNFLANLKIKKIFMNFYYFYPQIRRFYFRAIIYINDN